ncbi:hypothetical protein [Wenzhouxiangella sediminis]|uniref:Uncharacterized protein n=1 Tax=Wenzhouxiangella sediminis TaxID=1792836 RepID=A0A3E1K745_9GAMM|nr:hypothetical protein [Wenzhouxiangella sediminis]RFF29844.1 hypothetical protein DZC52_10395 [Wenzhouxiangella sediminis]
MDDAIDFTRMNRSGPPDDLWPAIAGELDRHRKHRLVRRVSALAAMVTVVVLASVFVQMPEPTSEPGTPSTGSEMMSLADLRAASARLENRLADHRQRPVGGLELESLLWLETELAWLDQQLAEAPADPDLWRQRIELLAELNRRYADGDWRREMLLASV